MKYLVMTIAAATIPAAPAGVRAGYLDALQTVAAAIIGGWALIG